MFRHKRCSIIVFIAIITLTILLLTSCAGTLTKKKATEPSAVPLVHTGTKGIEMKFLQGYPPDKFYYDSNAQSSGRNKLDFSIEIRNSGTSDVSGQLFISGFDPNILVLDSYTKSIPQLDPKSMSNPEGGLDMVSFSTNRIDIPSGVETYEPTTVITACYDYKTIATPMICVDPDPYAIATDKVCVPGAVQTGAGQGAPLAISSIVVEPVPGKLQLRIDITNSGGGTVINPQSIQNCPNSLEYSDYNSINVDRVFVQGIGNLRCNPSTTRLTSNKLSIYCSGQITAVSAYTTPVTIELSYGYISSISKKISIRNLQS